MTVKIHNYKQTYESSHQGHSQKKITKFDLMTDFNRGSFLYFS